MADWKEELSGLFEKKQEQQKVAEQKTDEARDRAVAWFQSEAAPAYSEIKTELESHGRTVEIYARELEAGIKVTHEGKLELSHVVIGHVGPGGTRLEVKGKATDRKDGKTYGWSSMVGSSSDTTTVEKAKKADLIAKFLEDYKRQLG